ncbi:TPA: hypothetical protein ACSC6M_002872 [Enterobacter roggenkampii]|jgi:flavin reductase (DIM6/NTAB) family NADH-FMN oxidoreductase RutF|uniref:hypothetical protein n=1 Tax=Enterobacter roggenkampii TaxID=1812935 RepID=UPI00377055B2
MKTQQVDFASLYFGTPVAIISSQNPVGSTNLSPISSWWILDPEYHVRAWHLRKML